MRSVLSFGERDRRWRAISDAMGREGLDALVVVGSAYNGGGGQKGALRYVADHKLGGFHAYAVLAPGREPTVILSAGLESSWLSDWVSDYRFARSMGGCLVDVLKELGSRERVGVVGLSQVMRVDEYRFLTESLEGTEFVEATPVLDSVRSVKSAEEVRGLEEAAYITDRCLKRLVEIVRPGMTRRLIAAEMYKTYAELGGEDPIFLCMDGYARDGEARVSWSRQDDVVLSPSDLFTFSFELIGPSGYWVELARMIVFAPPSEDKVAIHAAIVSAMEAAKAALRPGAAAEDVQRAIVGVAESSGTRLAWWSGHGIGQDVMEAPAVGREVMQDVGAARSGGLAIAESMVFAIHPLLVPVRDGVAGYMADTYVVGADDVRQLSKYPPDLLEVF